MTRGNHSALASNMWFGKLSVIFAVLCCLCFTSASDCPEFKCIEPKWCSGELYETYFYLDDNTRCSGCKKCVTSLYESVIESDPSSGMTCPPMACPMWRIPKSCKPRFYSLLINYKGKECSACDTFQCTGKA